MKHKEIGLGFNHRPYNWEYADAAAREADVSLLVGDVGKLARDLDTNGLFMLVDVTPTWVAVGVGSSGVAAGSVSIVDAAGYFSSSNVEDALQEAGEAFFALQSSVEDSPSGNQLVDGGGVALAPAGGLNIIVAPASYLIQGTLYSSPLTAITLTAADSTNPRIDVVAVNTSGAAVVIVGTPATFPAKPDVDPSTQLELTFLIIPAGATDLDIEVVDVYKNNAEWTSAVVGGSSINPASSSNPYTGALCVEATSVSAGQYVQFTKPSSGTFDPADFDNLVFFFRSKAVWAANRLMTISIRNAAGAQLGGAVTFDDGTFGFSSAVTATYQQIVIPAALFGANGQVATTIRFAIGGSGSNIGFYLDDITLQGGFASTTDATRMRWAGNWNVTKFYNANDVVLYSGIQYVALQAGSSNTPSTATTYWQASSAGGGSAAGSNTHVQYNASGAFAGSAAFTYNPTSNNVSLTGRLLLPATSTAFASVNLPHGTAPTSPTDGDVWTTTGGLFARINGATVGPYGTGGGGGTPAGSDTQVQFNDGGAFGGDTGLVFNKTTNVLTAGGIVVPSGNGILAQDATDSTSPTTGSLQTAGGLGVVKRINAGDRITTAGSLVSTGFTTVSTGDVMNIGVSGTQGYVEALTGGAGMPLNMVSSETKFLNASFNETCRYTSARNVLIGTTSETGLTGAGNLKVAGTVITGAATTSLASLNMAHGTAPTSPTNGDLWTTTSGLFARINGTTVGPMGSSGGVSEPLDLGVFL